MLLYQEYQTWCFLLVCYRHSFLYSFILKWQDPSLEKLSNQFIQSLIQSNMKFTIKAGRHYASRTLRMRILWGRKITFRFRIAASCLYNPNTVINGWSKVFGVAEPLGHINSCRLVFICDQDGFRVGMYVYRNGVSPQEEPSLKKDLGRINAYRWYRCTIEKCQGYKGGWYYSMKVISDDGQSNSNFAHMPAGAWNIPLRFLLHPYIGGRFTLDKDCEIEIERIKN